VHFKSLELVGFKSFAEKTRFDFEPGVTAIVGPNGCGKSNVADAIRWVMGEQNARLLRGLKMEDVIFNGTDQRKPLGLAEVSLTLSGVDKRLSVDYSEITVTRRVLRSGEGQYFINKNPCRLKDIDDLFMGTGIGLSAYSIIEQGKIELILSSKPEDRRFIFEEAAGITRYKEKKREALRKLESTEENLLRLSDIIREVKRQLASVERQAARARRAKELGDTLKGLEIQAGAKRLSEMDLKAAETEETRAAAKAREAEIGRLIEELEAEQVFLRESLHSIDRELGTVHARRAGVSGSIEQNRHRIETNERLIRELGENEELYGKEIEDLKATLGALEKEEGDLKAALEEAAGECRKSSDDLNAAVSRLESVRKSLREGEEGENRQRTELIEIISVISRCKNELAGNVLASRNAALRATRLQVEERELAEKIELARSECGEKQTRRKDLEAVRGAAAKDLEAAEERLRSVRRAEIELGEERLRDEKALASLESRRELLERYRDAREGFSEGVQVVMREAGREGGALGGVMGVIAERVRAHPGYELAIESALGHALQCIVTNSMEGVSAAISFLKGSADAAFLPNDELLEAPALEAPQGEGLRGSAMDFVAASDDFIPVVKYLLRDTYVVSTLDDALKLRSVCRPGVKLAACSGELLVVRGEVSVRSAARSPSPIFTRASELEQVLAELESQRARSMESARRAGEIERERGEIEGTLVATREKLQQSEIDLAEARTEELRMTGVFERLEGERAAAREEHAEIEATQRESEAAKRSLEEEIASAEKRQTENQEALGARRGALEVCAKEQEQFQLAVTELKMFLAAAREKESSRREALERVTREVVKSTEALKTREEQRLKASSRRSDLAVEIETLRSEIESLVSERDTTETDARQREERKAAAYRRQAEVEELLREKIASLSGVKDEIGRVDVALAEHGAARRTLLERIREQYGEDLTGVGIDPEISDWGEVEATIGQLKEKIARIGPVNMIAIEEHKELEERLKYLTDQEQDLLNAKDSLAKAIAKMNVETTRMFTTTFETIRNNFKEIYKELFGGGSTDLILEEGVDVLEAGVNIVARPPGKKLQNISLLSGGEKALTAIALLFAIFKVRPSPFCVLDEIDAPLDESNINRFLAMLGRFLKESQFIIVTHNKRTISMADVMYGITMEESGVSKVVSVKFGKGHGKKKAEEKE
jgi:chromosome segregation protein